MHRKILVLSNNSSGLVYFRREVLEALAKQGNALTVAAPEDFKTDIIKEMGCRFIPLSFNRQGTNPVADFKLMLAYCRIIRRERPDLVLTYTIKPNLYGGMACRLTHIPQIANITGLGIAAEKKGILKFIIHSLYHIGLKKAEYVYVQNKYDQTYCAQNGFTHGNSILIPGSGVNLDFFFKLSYPPSDTCKFIFIGRIQKRKGIDIYIETAKIIKEKYPFTEFHVLGRCEDSKYIRVLDSMEAAGYIKYHGHVSDIRHYLKDIHCTIHPSYYNEGMSNVLLESCSSGRPVITTKKAGCADVVEDGKNGFIMENIDASSLVKCVEMFINLPYEKKSEMGDYSRKKMIGEFDRQIVVKSYLKTINEIFSRMTS